MDVLIAASYSAASTATARQDSLGGLILAAGQDPTPDSIEAEKQGELQSAFALEALKKATSMAQQEGTDLATLLAQESGIGTNFSAYV